MAHITDDRVLESTTTTGTGALALGGALTSFKAFGSVMTSPSDTCWYVAWGVDGSGNPTGEFEEGLGTYSAANTLSRPATPLKSSNGGALVSFSAGTKYVAITAVASKVLQFDPNNCVLMPIAPSNPASAPTDTLYFYARKISGRVMPKWMPPSGLDNPVQPALFGNNVVLYMPNTGTTNGLNLGTPWVAGGTVSHPTPSSTSPAIANQMKRTRLANVVTTTNQVLGESSMASGAQQFWLGNAAGLGGFFFFTRFIIELWPAATVRLFAGLSASTTAVVASDTVVNNTVGLWHDTTDSASTISLVTKGTGSATKTGITLANALAAGQAFDFYMYAKPNDSTIYYRLDDINGGTTLVDSSVTATLPANTAFMGPQVHMSNGTANTTATTVAIGINRIYVESDH